MSTKLEMALAYLKMGWSIIPVQINKIPYVQSWAKYQKILPTEAEVLEWWTKWPDANIALITGDLSGVVVLDFDTKHNRTSGEFKMPITVCSKTGGGGEHFFFKHPKNLYIKSLNGKLFGAGIDLKADGGYVVLPTSNHISGNTYEWIIDPSDTDLAEIPSWLMEKFELPDSNNGSQSHSIFDGVVEGNRNSTATVVIGSLLQDLAIHKWDKVAWPLLVGWNTRCTPQLSEKELRTVFESISKAELNKRNLSEGASEIGDAISLIDLLEKDFPPVDWSVESLFDSGTINMISAAPHQYKSWIIHHMAICIASGVLVFGKFPTKKQNVMIVNEEDTESLLKNRSLMLLKEKEDLPIYFHVAKGSLINDELVEKLISEMKSKKVTFLIFDSLRSIHNLEENSSKDMQYVMNLLKKITREGITILFTHHNRKKFRGPGNSENSGSEDSRGSSSINAAVHGHISSEPRIINDKNYLVITQHKLKCDKKIDPFKVEIIHDEINKKMSFRYEGDFDQNLETQSHVSNEILAELEFSPEWLSVKDLIDKNIAGVRTIRDAVRDLTRNKVIISKTRKELKEMNIHLKSSGRFDEKFYSKDQKELQVKPIVYEEGY